MASGIYAIIHRESGRWYVGQSQNLRKRLCDHRLRLTRGYHANSHLQNAWNKYGSDAFDFEILILSPVSALDDLEQAYLDDPETSHFNIARDPTAPTRGLKLSAEHRAKISVSNKNLPKSAEHRAKLREANVGRKHSDAARAKMSKLRQGRKLSTSHRASLSAAQRGRTHSFKSKRKMSISKIGRQAPGTRSDNTSGFKGVSLDKGRSKWAAEITHNRRHIHLGRFTSPEDAARAYDRKARELHGEFACLNFPKSSH